jgi:F-type H+-transporting ATPase subunit delta
VTPLARSYSQAFLEAAPSGYAVGRFLEAARSVERAISENAPLRAFLSAPNVALPVKQRALEEVARRAGADDYGRRLLAVVLGNRRIARLPEILTGLAEAEDERQGVVAARVTVAAPIGDAEKARIEASLSKRAGRRVRMRVEVDPKVLAGFVARVGSEVLDASADNAIERFRAGSNEKSGV